MQEHVGARLVSADVEPHAAASKLAGTDAPRRVESTPDPCPPTAPSAPGPLVEAARPGASAEAGVPSGARAVEAGPVVAVTSVAVAEPAVAGGDASAPCVSGTPGGSARTRRVSATAEGAAVLHAGETVAPGTGTVPQVGETPAPGGAHLVGARATAPAPSGGRRQARHLDDIGRDVVFLREFAARFPRLADIWAAHQDSNGGTVPLLGILERLIGAVRRGEAGATGPRRSSRGGGRGGAVERMAERLEEAEREVRDLRRHSESVRSSLADAHRRLDAAIAARDRAAEDERRAARRADDAEDELRSAKRRRTGDGGGRGGPDWCGSRWDDGHGGGGGARY